MDGATGDRRNNFYNQNVTKKAGISAMVIGLGIGTLGINNTWNRIKEMQAYDSRPNMVQYRALQEQASADKRALHRITDRELRIAAVTQDSDLTARIRSTYSNHQKSEKAVSEYHQAHMEEISGMPAMPTSGLVTTLFGAGAICAGFFASRFRRYTGRPKQGIGSNVIP
jgi:hypothetical protein